MSYHIEKSTGDLVIEGWEQGIASSPLKGFGDLKCGNISSIPGEVSLNYNRVRQSNTRITGGTLTAVNSVFVNGPTTLQVGAIIFITASTITGLGSSTQYFIAANVNGLISLAQGYGGGSPVTGLGTTGTATFNTLNMGKPISYAVDYGLDGLGGILSYYVLDDAGFVWKTPPGAQSSTANLGIWVLIDGAPKSGATAIFSYGGDYIHIVLDKIYWKATGSIGGLNTGWQAMTGTTTTISTSHFALLGHDSGNGTVYITDGSQIDTLAVVPGSTYDPSNTATFTFSFGALMLPSFETATKLAEIATGAGTQLIIGGINNVLYPWDKLSPFYGPVIFLPENYTQQLVSVNNLVYIFCGSKGNIYITNGSSVTAAMTVPDYIPNSLGSNQDPFYIWGGSMYLRGRIWFSIQGTNCGGIWSFVPTQNYYVEQDAGLSLRLENQNSYGTYSGMATILFAPQLPTSQNVNGPQYWAGWDDGSSGASALPYGIDFSDTIPFQGGAIVESDLIPSGTILDKKTFKNLEFKLTTPLTTTTTTAAIASGATSATLSSNWTGVTGTQVLTFSDGSQKTATVTNGSAGISWSGGLTNAVTSTLTLESVYLKYRTNLTMPWVSAPGNVIFETATTYSGYYVVDFENTQWVQIQMVLNSTTQSPSFTRVAEVRLR